MIWRWAGGEGEVGQRCPTALAMTDRSVKAHDLLSKAFRHHGDVSENRPEDFLEKGRVMKDGLLEDARHFIRTRW